jgi:acyl-ACP thioesterase
VFLHRETVRFSDLDPMGHVNNAVYEKAVPIEIPAEWRERLAA